MKNSKYKNLGLMLVSILTVSLLASCNKASKPVGDSYLTEAQKNAAVYPHTTIFRITGNHGIHYLSDATSCMTCHGTDLKGQNAAPACSQCHGNFPHPADFKTSGLHAADYKDKPKTCLMCHTLKTTNGAADAKGPPACTSCHSYPHSSGWVKATDGAGIIHGQEYLKQVSATEKPAVTCQTCHGEDLKGGKVAVSCNACHAQYPHAAEFSKSKDHAKLYFTDQKQCTVCHSTQIVEKNPTDPAPSAAPACASCHGYPHVTKWSKPENHGAQFIAMSDTNESARPAVTCENCHTEKSGFGTRNPNQYVKCDQCHISMPHPEPFEENHYDKPAGETQSVAANPKNACVKCHTDYKRLMSPVGYENQGCLYCHDTGIKTQTQWTK